MKIFEKLIKIRRKTRQNLGCGVKKNDFFEISKNCVFLPLMTIKCYFLQFLYIKQICQDIEHVVETKIHDQIFGKKKGSKSALETKPN